MVSMSNGLDRLVTCMLIYVTDMQCAYNITLRRVHATIITAEKQLLLHILSVCL